MPIVRDVKSGEFYEIPDKDAQKFAIAPEKVREKLGSLAEEGPQGPPQGPPGTLVLNLNLADLIHQAAGPGPGGPPPGPAGPGPGGPMPVGAGHPHVSAQWWQWHPNHPYWGYHPYYGNPAPGVWVRL